jgi:endonuclease/exonuclease/phosphatase family metal-dependent hydrolase
LNTYNLFDTVHDQGKQDYAYLPKSSPLKKHCKKVKKNYRQACYGRNWTKKKLAKKITKLCQIINLSKADMVGLVEVENKNVLKQLASKCGYDQIFITEGEDQRGIDQALMVRKRKDLKFLGVSDIPVRDFRSLLKTKWAYGKKEFTLVVTHWPSQRSPREKRFAKAQAALKKIDLNTNVIVMGDFNIVEREEKHLKKIWPLENIMKEKTYFYPKEMVWNNFDRFYITENFKKQFNILKSTIFVPYEMKSVFEYSDKKKAFYGSRVVGVPNKKYSDHFPIILKISN